MTNRRISLVASLFSLALFLSSACAAASGQDRTEDSAKKAAEPRKIDVQVEVSRADGKPVPAGAFIEISGHDDPLCRILNQNDAQATVDDKGEAIFRGIPACRVAVKINLPRYEPVREVVDLNNYRSCGAGASANKSDKGAGAQSACISLLLKPLP